MEAIKPIEISQSVSNFPYSKFPSIYVHCVLDFHNISILSDVVQEMDHRITIQKTSILILAMLPINCVILDLESKNSPIQYQKEKVVGFKCHMVHVTVILLCSCRMKATQENM